MGRIVAIDYGKKRTGIAVTDTLKIIAQGLKTVATEQLIYELKQYFASEPIEKVILGYPVDLDGNPTENTFRVEKFQKNFIKVFPTIPIEYVDERYTSKMAFQTMIDSGLKKKARQNKALIDEISATIMLQEYLGNL